MKVFHSLSDYIKSAHPVVTIGTFDGVHIGHQRIIKQINELAEQNGGESVLLTFWPHPRLVLEGGDSKLKLLNTLEEKQKLLDYHGLDSMVVLPFDETFARQSATEYIRDILVNGLGVKSLVIGYDHRFGKNREGSFDNLKEAAPTYGFDLHEIPAQEIEDVTISSTKIRDALMEGGVETAASYMGHYYSLTGIVIKGDQIGRDIGYPTANIKIDQAFKLIPAEGVYLVKSKIDDNSYFGMMNIGRRPTISDDGELRLEVNFFDLEKDLYDRELKIEFLAWIRSDEKLANLNALKEQITRDKEVALRKSRSFRL